MVEDLSFNVNRSRRNGFYKALIKNGIPEREQLYYTGALKIDFLDTIISDMIAKKVQCIICGDDVTLYNSLTIIHLFLTFFIFSVCLQELFFSWI